MSRKMVITIGNAVIKLDPTASIISVISDANGNTTFSSTPYVMHMAQMEEKTESTSEKPVSKKVIPNNEEEPKRKPAPKKFDRKPKKVVATPDPESETPETEAEIETEEPENKSQAPFNLSNLGGSILSMLGGESSSDENITEEETNDSEKPVEEEANDDSEEEKSEAPKKTARKPAVKSRRRVGVNASADKKTKTKAKNEGRKPNDIAMEDIKTSEDIMAKVACAVCNDTKHRYLALLSSKILDGTYGSKGLRETFDELDSMFEDRFSDLADNLAEFIYENALPINEDGDCYIPTEIMARVYNIKNADGTDYVLWYRKAGTSGKDSEWMYTVQGGKAYTVGAEKEPVDFHVINEAIMEGKCVCASDSAYFRGR